MKKYAIIVAGGEGRRVGGDTPKQFLEICGMPMLYHTMRVFYDENPHTEIIVVLHPEYIEEWEDYMHSLPDTKRIPFTPICGGMSRTHSVFNGLLAIADTNGALVAIHDAARPLLTIGMLREGWSCAGANGSAVPVVKVTDSLREMLDDGTSTAVDRNKFCAVQTPQIFSVSLIKNAYSDAGINLDTIGRPSELHKRFTDDGAIVEASGKNVSLYHGSPRNIKITTPVDLKIAEILLNE